MDAYTAVARLATAKDDITPEERQVWKRVFLAILYGAGVKRVREVWIEETGEVISDAQSRKIVDAFKRNWPAVKALQERVIAQHHERGYIIGLGGRHLHMEEFGEHKLLNKLIQNSAADWMKLALLRVDEWLLSRPDVLSRMVSVIHDEIIFDGPEREIPILHESIPPLMADIFPAVTEVVPVTVDHEVSVTNWAEKIEYEEWLDRTHQAAA